MVDLSGLVEWVPATAIAGAAGAYIFRVFEARQARQRELKGLIRLLGVEIKYNERILKLFAERPHAIGRLAEGAGLHTRAWQENRERIAQLMKGIEDFQRLANYFMNVAVIETERLAGGVPPESLEPHTALLLGQGEEAKEVIEKVAGAEVETQVGGPALEAPRDDS